MGEEHPFGAAGEVLAVEGPDVDGGGGFVREWGGVVDEAGVAVFLGVVGCGVEGGPVGGPLVEVVRGGDESVREDAEAEFERVGPVVAVAVGLSEEALGAPCDEVGAGRGE